VSLNTDNGESHPSEVTEGIPWESSSGVPSHMAQRQPQNAQPKACRIVPVVIQEAGTNSQQWQHEVEAEQVSLHEQPTSMGHTRAPHTADPDFAADLGLTSQQVQGDSPVDWPRKVQKVVDNYGYSDNDSL